MNCGFRIIHIIHREQASANEHFSVHPIFTDFQFDYVMFTGDLPPHNVWNQSRDDQITSLQTYTDLMKKYLPNKMVYNTLGNHESAPVNRYTSVCIVFLKTKHVRFLPRTVQQMGRFLGDKLTIHIRACVD